MNPSERNLAEPVHFVTAAVGGWKHLVTNEACARTVFDSLDYLSRTGKIALYAYALLPSHLCLLCRRCAATSTAWWRGSPTLPPRAWRRRCEGADADR